MNATVRTLLWLIVLTPVALFAFLYPRLPASMAMQWTMTGAEGWHGGKLFFGACLSIEPVILLILSYATNAAFRDKARDAGALYPAILLMAFTVGAGAEVMATLQNLPR
jgi:uncharacterized membrane protein